MTKIIVIGPNLPRGANPTGGAFVAHRAGCRDAAKLLSHPSVGKDGGWEIDAATRDEVGEAVYGDHIEEGSMVLAEAVRDIHFLPCCGLKDS